MATFEDSRIPQLYVVLLIAELTTFFVNNLQLGILHKCDKSALWFKLNGIFLTVFFFLIRIVFCLYIDYYCYIVAYPLETYKNNWEWYAKHWALVQGLILTALQFVWFKKILSGLVKSLTKKVDKTKTE